MSIGARRAEVQHVADDAAGLKRHFNAGQRLPKFVRSEAMYSFGRALMASYKIDQYEGGVVAGIRSEAGGVTVIEAGVRDHFFQIVLRESSRAPVVSISATMAVVFSMREPSGALTIIVKLPASILGKNSVCKTGKEQGAGADERQQRRPMTTI